MIITPVFSDVTYLIRKKERGSANLVLFLNQKEPMRRLLF